MANNSLVSGLDATGLLESVSSISSDLESHSQSGLEAHGASILSTPYRDKSGVLVSSKVLKLKVNSVSGTTVTQVDIYIPVIPE
jgi:hypothetical protein